MNKTSFLIISIVFLASCNIRTTSYPLIYTTEEPNELFAKRLKEVLEDSYNVDIRLVRATNAQSIIDSLENENLDMGLVENLVDTGEGVNSVVPVFTKILHLFYKKELRANSMEELLHDRTVYIGRQGSAAYSFMMDLFGYYNLDMTRVTVSNNMFESDVLALFSIIMQKDELVAFDGYKLYSIASHLDLNQGSEVEGIALNYPRIKPYVIPKTTYGELTKEPIVTIATDMMYVVREGMGATAVADLTRSIFAHRDKFVHLNPSFYFGIVENFDRSKLSYPLHEGARAFLDRDEPSFVERYAELGGVILAVIIALGSGMASLSKWKQQNKKDKVDVFYKHLMNIKNQMPTIRSLETAKEKIQEVKDEQNKAFKMLINEELEANDSFRIYMELSKETIQDIRLRLRLLKNKSN